MKARKNVPELRFPGFEDEWEEKMLGEISTFYMYGMNAPAIPYDGKYKYIRITDIDEDTHKYKPSPLVSPAGEIDDRYKLMKGDLVFARTGASVGKSYLYKPEDGDLYFAGFLIKFHISDSEDARFIYYNTLTQRYNNWVSMMSIRSGQPGINAEEFSVFSFYDTTLFEQAKIADFLSDIDLKIEKLSRKKELMVEYKKGMMQKLFSQEIRFKDEKGEDYPDWEEKRLGEYIFEYKEKSRVQDEFEVFTSSRLGIVKQKNYFENSRITERDNIGFNIIPPEYLTYRSRSDDGYFKFNINNLKTIGIISTYYPVFSANNGSNKFFVELLNFHRDIFIQYAVGTSQVVLSFNSLKEIKLPIPILSEQSKIANFLSDLDLKIQHIEKELSAVKEFKKGLLQKMFV